MFNNNPYRLTDAREIRGRLIVSADRVSAAIIQHVATDVVLQALLDTVAVVSLDANALVATVTGRYAVCVHMALWRIRRAIGHHATSVDHAEAGIAGALVPRTGRIVQASFVLRAIRVPAAFVCTVYKGSLLQRDSRKWIQGFHI